MCVLTLEPVEIRGDGAAVVAHYCTTGTKMCLPSWTVFLLLSFKHFCMVQMLVILNECPRDVMVVVMIIVALPFLLSP